MDCILYLYGNGRILNTFEKCDGSIGHARELEAMSL